MVQLTLLPVSVVIPLYNHEKYIVDTLESVFIQSSSPAEVIVVDDGSIDKSASIIRDYSRNRSELIFWSQPNQGAHQAINSGIHRATNDYVAILNSDDAYHCQRLEKCVDILQTDPEISVVATEIDFMNDKGKIIKNSWYDQARSNYKETGDLGLALMNGNFIMTTSNFVLRRTLFEEAGYFAPLRYAHDLEFLLRLIFLGKKIHIIKEKLLTYRVHQKNTISEDHKKVRVEWAFCCAGFIWMTDFKKHGESKGWVYLEKMAAIMDKHNLTKLVLYFLSYFQESSSNKNLWLCLADDDFFDFIYKVS